MEEAERLRRGVGAPAGGYEAPLAVWGAADTDVGRKREQNEDGFLCLPDHGLFVVADGMGGEAAGKEASRLALEWLEETLTEERLAGEDRPLEGELQEALEGAGQCILETARSHLGWEQRVTTVVVVRDSVVHLSHVGDGRAYLVRERKAAPLTGDHWTVMARGRIRSTGRAGDRRACSAR